MTASRKPKSLATKPAAPRKTRSLSGKGPDDNLPPVSKQTAGGIAGAAIGGIVAGPLGAVVAGVAGALVGNAAAAGEHPIKRTVDGIRSVAEQPTRRAYASVTAAIARHRVSKKKAKASAKKATDKKATAKKAASKSRSAGKASKSAK